ncbi:MAG: triose-phosphate isomerase [Parcubacteria group bacterium]|jgi:triosephosphate isomerase
MNKKLVVGNMKMNPVSPVEFGRYLDGLEKETKGEDFERAEIVICPPAVYFRQFLERKFKNVKLGAQDVFWEYQGAYTGQISAGMIKANGAQYAIVGHSERRKYFGENEEVINLKLKAILKNGLRAILCIGENMEERRSNQTVEVIKKQLKGAVDGVGSGKIEYVDIVYEPSWSVGSDNVPASDEILEAKLIIKKILAEIYGHKAMERVRILYGGSIAVRFANQVCINPAMDGGLIGRESLVPYDFIKIAKVINES